MGGYIANFTVYTMAMTGLICFAVFVYKKITDGSLHSKNAKFLSVEDSMNLSPRKSIHVIRAGNERFLIASDVDRTTLISKLEKSNQSSITTTNNNISTKNDNIINKIFPNEKLSNESDKNFLHELEIQDLASENKSNKIIHFEQVDPKRKRTVIRQKLDSIADNKEERAFSPMKEMAKRINEL